MIKKTILAIMLAALPVLLPPLRAEAGLTLVSADAHSAVVEYRTEAPVFSGDPASPVVQMDGCQLYGAPGQPGLLQCLAHVAVPEGAQVSVEVVDARSSDYPGVKLAPVPDLALNRDGLDRLVYRADAAAYGSPALQPSELARAVSVAPLRQLTVATVALRPLQYAPSSGLLRVYTVLRVRIAWTGGSTAAAAVNDPGFEPVLRQLVLNYDAAGMWARSQPAEPVSCCTNAQRRGFPSSSARQTIQRSSMHRVTEKMRALAGIAAVAAIAFVAPGHSARAQDAASETVVVTVDGKNITANTPGHIEALEWIQSYSLKYDVNRIKRFSSGFGNFASPQNPFFSGKLAMVLHGVWLHSYTMQYAPGMDYGAAPWPKTPRGPENFTLADADVLIIPAGVPQARRDAAWEFVKFVSSQRGMETLNLGQRKNTPLAEVSKGFIENHPHRYIKLFIDLSKGPGVWHFPQMGIWSRYDNEIRAAVEKMRYLQVNPDTHKPFTAKEALDVVQSRIGAAWDRYQESLALRGKQEVRP